MPDVRVASIGRHRATHRRRHRAIRGPGTGSAKATVRNLADATRLQQWLQAIGGGLDRPPCNLWLHRVPAALLAAGESFHWHFELQPRTGQLAGLELGGDMYINSVSAEVTAARLRRTLIHILRERRDRI